MRTSQLINTKSLVRQHRERREKKAADTVVRKPLAFGIDFGSDDSQTVHIAYGVNFHSGKPIVQLIDKNGNREQIKPIIK